MVKGLIEMELKDFVDRGEQTKEGDKLVLKYNKTLGCAAANGGYYLDSFALIGPKEGYCCEKMDKAMDGIHPVFDLQGIGHNEKNPAFGILFISEYSVESLERDESIWVDFIPIEFCPFCGARIVLKLNELFQLKLKKKVETTCTTYKEKIEVD